MAIQWGPGSSVGSSQVFYAGVDVESTPVSSAFGAVEVKTSLYLRTDHRGTLSSQAGYALSGSATALGANVQWLTTFLGNHALIYSRTDLTLNAESWVTSVSIQPSQNGVYGSGWVHVTASWPLNPQAPDAPAPPQGLSVVRHNDTYQDLSWENVITESAPYTEVQVWRNIDGGAFELIATLPVSTTYRATTLPNRVYGFRLRAVNSTGASGFTEPVYISTTPAAPRQSPGVTQLEDGTVRIIQPLSFTDLPPVVTHWQVWSSMDDIWDSEPLATLPIDVHLWDYSGPLGGGVGFRVTYQSSNPTLTSLPSPETYLSADTQPKPPTNLSPHGIQVNPGTPVELSWTFNSTDGSAERLSQVRYRDVLGPQTWITTEPAAARPALELDYGPVYEWQVRTWGASAVPSEWSEVATFSTAQPIEPPVVVQIAPVMVWRAPTVRFTWTYRQNDGLPQEQWWIELVDVATNTVVTTASGHNPETRSWTAVEVIQEGRTYLWRLWVKPQGAPATSPVSTSFLADFSDLPDRPNVIVGGVPLPDLTIHVTEHNHHRVSVFEKGGKHRLFDLDKTELVRWSRELDHTGEATVMLTPPFGGCGTRLREIVAMRHELVIYFNGQRCWEGPLTYIKDTPGSFTMKAKDVTCYLNRMVMRQRYSSRLPGNQRETVMDRVWRIIQWEGARFEEEPLPINVLPYVTLFRSEEDVKTARITLPGEKYVFDELDDLAWKSGLDYGVAGRRIYLMDTDTPVGRVRRLTTADFTDPVEVVFYGAELATEAYVTDRQGRYVTSGPGASPYYGRVELLHGNYAEADNPEAAAAIPLADMEAQARRDFSPRYPMPMAVRVPQNAGMNHNTFLELYNSLFPGVRVPITAEGTVHNVSRMMKLKTLKVEELEGRVNATVTLSPASEAAGEFEDE